METALIIALVIGAVLVVLWFVNQKVADLKAAKLDEAQAKTIVNEVYGEVAEKVIAQAKSLLEADKEAIYKDNQHKKEVLERLITGLKEELAERQKEIRDLERDRNKQYGDITRSIEEHRKITDSLKTSTEALAKVLSNNQMRGQWGERIIEDILVSAGLLETVHYLKQTPLPNTTVKPDITLLLPNERRVCVDCKFPYAAIQQLAAAETESAKQLHLKQFEKDVKEKISQIEKYIDTEAGTLDYALLFVPNEMVFSFINQQFPQLIDEAMKKKIMIVSPFTFLIVARTVMEAYRNFMVENNLRKIINHIGEFTEEWTKFSEEFTKFEGMIGKLRDQYDSLRTTRYKKMSRKISQIEAYRHGSLASQKKSPAVIEAETV